MPVLDAHGDELEPPYAVPTHLETSESIGPIPHRLWVVGLSAWISSSLLLASFHPTDDVLKFALQWGPPLLLAPFGVWWMKPPPEHGLVTAMRHLLRPRLLDPDRLAGYQRMRVENGALYAGSGEACLTIWRLPTVNLEVASVAAKRRHRAQWGAFLDGLGHEVTVVIRARRMRRLQAIYEVFEHGSDEAKVLARWLQGTSRRPHADRARATAGHSGAGSTHAAESLRRHSLEHGPVRLATGRAGVGPRPGAAGQQLLAARSRTSTAWDQRWSSANRAS